MAALFSESSTIRTEPACRLLFAAFQDRVYARAIVCKFIYGTNR